jgi:hypothetical protein
MAGLLLLQLLVRYRQTGQQTTIHQLRGRGGMLFVPLGGYNKEQGSEREK